MSMISPPTQEYKPKFPLLIDPDGVGCQRIQELEADNKLVTIDMGNRYFLENVQNVFCWCGSVNKLSHIKNMQVSKSNSDEIYFGENLLV